jgi:hypothetical protein
MNTVPRFVSYGKCRCVFGRLGPEWSWCFCSQGKNKVNVWTLREKEILILRSFWSCYPTGTASDSRGLESSTESPSEPQQLNLTQENVIQNRQSICKCWSYVWTSVLQSPSWGSSWSLYAILTSNLLPNKRFHHWATWYSHSAIDEKVAIV